MKEVKNFYISITFLGVIFVALMLKSVSNSFEMFGYLGIFFYSICWMVVFILRCFGKTIKLPFLTDLVDSPTTPTYRISENCYRDRVVVKSEVGYTHFYDDIIFIFPPTLLLEYKTMIDFEDKFEIEGSLEDILKIGLKEFWESEYYHKNQEYIESEEAENKSRNQLQEINKEYLNNFK